MKMTFIAQLRDKSLRSTIASFLLLTATTSMGQSLISDTEFFDPDFRARRPGIGAPIAVEVDTSLYSEGPQTAGNVTWLHQAGGLVHGGVLDIVDVQLAAFTQTLGNSLVFGRELEVSFLGDEENIDGFLSDVIGASAINSWDAAATVTGLNLIGGQTYNVTFNVDLGDDLNIAALTSTNFRILNNGVALSNTDSSEVLDLLGILSLGSGSALAQFEFIAPTDLSALTFEFTAATIADVSLLGGITDNQDVITFTGFNLAPGPVPEPGSALLILLTGIFLLVYKRRISDAHS